MGIFFKVLGLFQKNKAHHQLLEAYAEVHRLASILPQLLVQLRAIQKELVKQKRAGGIGLQKTLFVEEEFMPRLRNLAQKAEQRYYEAINHEHLQQPISLLEHEELNHITSFLKKVRERVPNLNDIEAKPRPEEKLLAIESALREVAELAKDFYAVERYEKDLVRRVLQSELSPLLRRIYQKPGVITYREQGKLKHLYPSTLNLKELRNLENEAKKINAAHDPDYEIIWTHWWRDLQIPERDLRTPLKDPHINVTLKLAGKKKDLHLLLAA